MNPADVHARGVLPPGWFELRPHPVREALQRTTARFVVVPSGRRAGKSELALRRITFAAIASQRPGPGRFLFGAPTREQVREIAWDRLCRLVPPWFMRGPPREGTLEVRLLNGKVIRLFSMDRPERVEGGDLEGIVLDEYGNMAEETWPRHVRPALSDSGGWAWFIGTPEGRNHYYDLWQKAISGGFAGGVGVGEDSEWAGYTWKSADILPPKEIEQARRDLDPQTFAQEFEGDFVTFSGRVYYPFQREVHAARRLRYRPELPLCFSLDFNVDPGAATISQDVPRDPGDPEGEVDTRFIGEVYLEKFSQTRLVCKRFIADYAGHDGPVEVHGDPSGGARNTVTLDTNWDIVREELEPIFGDRLVWEVAHCEPGQQARVNAVNSRLRSMAGDVRLWVDPVMCPRLVRDFEGVTVMEDGSGRIDKTPGPLTHVSDAAAYLVHRKHPMVISRGEMSVL